MEPFTTHAFPSEVAGVLLVASDERRSMLEPAFQVIGAPVRYGLDVLSPERTGWPPADSGRERWDVVVVDGPSLRGGAELDGVLAWMSLPPHDFSTVVYVCSGSTSEHEVLAQRHRVDDVVRDDAELVERLRRRVQLVALAPWRRSCALRAHAERLGDRRLRVLGPPSDFGEGPMARARRIRRFDHEAPFRLLERASQMGLEVAELVAHAFHEGRRDGIAALHARADLLCADLIAEVAQAVVSFTDLPEDALLDRRLRRSPSRRQDVRRSDPPSMPQTEPTFPFATASAILAARFDGSRDALEVFREELGQLASQELARIDRHEACRAPES